MITAELHRRTTVNAGLPLLLWRLDPPMIVASTSPAGGGIGLRQWIVNAQVPSGYARRDPERHVDEIGSELALVGPGVGMLTAVDVAAVVRVEDADVSVETTVGISHPTWAAWPVSVGGEAVVSGTINIVAFVPAALSGAALLNSLCTATEAKSQALLSAGIQGTGTASDAITVVCPAEGRAEAFGGPRSRWGAPLARAVCQSVTAGCGLPEAQGVRS